MIFNGKLKELFFKSSDLYQFAGAIFDKELRVTSRRRRYYVLRVAYLVILIFLIFSAWTAGMAFSDTGGSSVYIASRMSEVGKGIIVSIAWTQFILLQFLAVVLLSSSISDEIYHRTLGVLMTTPISSFNIVTGKLLSRLLQLLLLLGISFPILAIVRVFGGVPWGYVVSSLLVTLTSAIFAGSLSQLFSIFRRRAHEVIILTVFVCGILYAAPIIAIQAYNFFYSPVPQGITNTANHANPFFVMAVSTQEMFTAAGATSISLPLHLAITLAGIILWVGLSVISVRRVGIRQATGDEGLLVSAKQKIVKRVKPPRRVSENTGKIRPVIGPPVIWKEIRGTFHKFRGLKNVLSFIIVMAVMIAGYLEPIRITLNNET